MNCDLIVDLMPAYESKAASAQTRQVVDEHLASCRTCRAAFAAGSLSEVGALPTPAEPDERDVLLRIRREIGALWSDIQPPPERPVLVRLREAFLNLLAGMPLFLVNAILLNFLYTTAREGRWWPVVPRQLPWAYPWSDVPSLLEMLLLLGILLLLRRLGRRYVCHKPPSRAATLSLGLAWLLLLALALLSFFTTGSLMVLVAPCLAMGLALTAIRSTPRLALGSIGLLTVANLGLTLYVLAQIYLHVLKMFVWE